MRESPSLGSCCICEATGPHVHIIVMLNAKTPVRGQGWGCVQCGIGSHGALAVICDTCEDFYPTKAAVEQALRFVCRGYLASGDRMAIADLRGEHGHDRSKHPEVPAVPPLTVLPTDTRFDGHIEEGQGCLCSRCGATIWEGTIAIRAFSQTEDWQYRYHPTCFGAHPMDENPYAIEDDAYDFSESPGEIEA